jgi:hypothetical protein
MTNIQTTYNLLVRQAYERDGVQDAVVDLRRSAARSQFFADDLTMTTVAPVNGSGTATVIATRAAKIFAISIDASGSAGFLQLQNNTSGVINSTQSGLTMVIPFAANETMTLRLYPGSQSTGVFSTGIVIGTCTTAVGTTAIATAVNKVMFLTNTAP